MTTFEVKKLMLVTIHNHQCTGVLTNVTWALYHLSCLDGRHDTWAWWIVWMITHAYAHDHIN